MALVTAPDFRIRSIEWTLDRPAQINVSAYTGRRKAVANPWHGKWRARVEMAPLVGSQMLEMRAFLASVRGRVNTFHLPATEGPQHPAGPPSPAITARVNTSSTAQGGGLYRIVKTGGTNAAHDADAVSSVVAGDFLLRIDWVANSVSSVAGLSANPSANAGVGFDYAWLQISGTQSAVRVNGAHFDTYTTSGPLWIRRVGTTLTFESGTPGSTTVHHTVTGVSAALGFDCSLYNSSATIDAGFPRSGATMKFTVAQGATFLTMTGVTTPLGAGQMLTVNDQLLIVEKAGVLVGSDLGVWFQPPLREQATAGAEVETANPYAHVAMAEDVVGWRADLGPIYGISFDVEEAF